MNVEQKYILETSYLILFIVLGDDLIKLKKYCGQIDSEEESEISEPFSPDVSEYIPSELGNYNLI